ncbi:MAG: MBL fold metallo-hydrolase, partial [Burkholderiales bacterium]|nr:MBL fold metallo-hydrolase [Burkholderiales bacterium]
MNSRSAQSQRSPATAEATDLSFPFDTVPSPGTVTEVADGVRWLRMPLPFALDHINLWLLRDGPGWAIVDCGYQSDQTREAWEPILAAHGPITRIIATH